MVKFSWGRARTSTSSVRLADAPESAPASDEPLSATDKSDKTPRKPPELMFREDLEAEAAKQDKALKKETKRKRLSEEKERKKKFQEERKREEKQKRRKRQGSATQDTALKDHQFEYSSAADIAGSNPQPSCSSSGFNYSRRHRDQESISEGARSRLGFSGAGSFYSREVSNSGGSLGGGGASGGQGTRGSSSGDIKSKNGARKHQTR